MALAQCEIIQGPHGMCETTQEAKPKTSVVPDRRAQSGIRLDGELQIHLQAGVGGEGVRGRRGTADVLLFTEA